MIEGYFMTIVNFLPRLTSGTFFWKRCKFGNFFMEGFFFGFCIGMGGLFWYFFGKCNFFWSGLFLSFLQEGGSYGTFFVKVNEFYKFFMKGVNFVFIYKMAWLLGYLAIFVGRRLLKAVQKMGKGGGDPKVVICHKRNNTTFL